MSKVRINDLARELEVKSKAILDSLSEVGVGGVKTHSSSLEGDEAERVRGYFRRGSSRNGGSTSTKQEGSAPRIDWSQVSKPGDVMRAIQQRKEEAEREQRRPAARPPVAAAPVATPAPASVQGTSAAPQATEAPASARPVAAAPVAAPPSPVAAAVPAAPSQSATAPS
ncbi:MAG: translation initiation factor IF-2 N-terminal domain-containing protein, partial [Acidobacteriaceae bacterium]